MVAVVVVVVQVMALWVEKVLAMWGHCQTVAVVTWVVSPWILTLIPDSHCLTPNFLQPVGPLTSTMSLILNPENT